MHLINIVSHTATAQGMTDNEAFFQTTCHNINSGKKKKNKEVVI